MKIALIDPSIFTWPYDSELAFALHEAGHDVRIFGRPLAASEGGPAMPLLRPHFYRYLDSKLARRLPKPVFLSLKGLAHISGLLRLWFVFRRWRPDAIHFQWAPLPAVDRWFIQPFRRLAPTVLTVHDSSPFNSAPIPRLQMLGAREIWKHFDHLLVHTQRAVDTLTESGIPSSTISQVAHGPLGGAGSLVRVVRQPALENARVRIVLFGRIREYKGPDILLRAAAAMPPEILKRCEIRIVGEPLMPLEPLQKIISDAGISSNVQLDPRYIPEAEVGTILSAADIIVLPYRGIDASGVLMMCLSAGVPIVASRIGLFEEMLADGVHGLLTPMEDHLALSQALSQLIENPQMRLKMGAEVRKLRESIQDWPSIAASTVEIYRKVGRHRGQGLKEPEKA